MKHKIYLASSWNNSAQPELVITLRQAGHEVFDFRNPPEPTNFNWSDVAPDPDNWPPTQYRNIIQHPYLNAAYQSDMVALILSDIVVLLLPCGKSAHSEAAWSAGRKRPVILHITEPTQPEIMHKMFNTITTNTDELLHILSLPLHVIGGMYLK